VSVCHSGHQGVTERKAGKFYCDCGNGGCEALKPKDQREEEKKEEEKKEGRVYALVFVCVCI